MKPKRVVEPPPIASRRRAEHIGVDDLRTLELEAEGYLEIDPKRAGAKHLRGVISAARLARLALDCGEAAGAVMAAMQALQSAWLAEIAEARPLISAGVATTRGAIKGNAEKQKQAAAQRAKWQRQAEAHWRRNPHLSASDVAELIDADRSDYIRMHIVKPQPK